MIPTLFQVPIPYAIPRVLLLLALTSTLIVTALALLMGNIRRFVVGLTVSILVFALLVVLRVAVAHVAVIRVSPWGASLCLSIITGSWLVLRLTPRDDVPRSQAAVRLCYVVLAGMVAAKVGDFVLNYDESSRWLDIVNFRRGGLFGYGGYVGGLLATRFSVPHGRVPYAKWLDQVCPAALLGVGLTRIGCYFQGCDFGRPLHSTARPLIAVLGTFPRWDVTSADRYAGSPAWISQVTHWGLSPDAPRSLPVHPVQLYEATLAFSLLFFVLFKMRARRPAGTQFLLSCALYSLGYFLLGFLRGDLQRTVLVVARFHWAVPVGSIEQDIALASCVLALLVWKSWKNEQAFLDKIRAIFRAEKAKI